MKSTRPTQSAQHLLRGLVFGVMVGTLALAVTLRAAQGSEWAIPADAPTLANPLASAPDALKKGADIFASKCKKCHGPEGRGDGPSSDPDHPAANLTAKQTATTADGVLFYKIWNGRKPMPAFKTSLEKDDIWAAILFVKSLGRE